MISIVDYGMGNLRSVANALTYIGETPIIVSSPQEIMAADRIILPGVGAFADAMTQLVQRELVVSLKKRAQDGIPILGICLGMQLLADCSMEGGVHEGLGLISGKVCRLGSEESGLVVPHMGWNELLVSGVGTHPILSKLRNGSCDVYFVHSYHFIPEHPNHVLARCEYGHQFVAAVGESNVIGLQFHPEKSQDNGLEILESFCDWNP